MRTADTSMALSSGTRAFLPAFDRRPHPVGGRAPDPPIVFVLSADAAMHATVVRLDRHAGWRCDVLTSSQDLLSRPDPGVPCCLVLDTAAGGIDALQVQQQLAGRPALPIIFVSGVPDVVVAVR